MVRIEELSNLTQAHSIFFQLAQQKYLDHLKNHQELQTQVVKEVH